MPPAKLLIVEDDHAVRAALDTALRLEGHDTALAGDGHAGLARAQGEAFDLLVLDVMMPGLDGLAVARWLRGRGDRTPILMLTARAAVADRVAGLDAGADDYLVKPFALEELRARVRALLRRPALAEGHRTRLAFADLELDCEAHTVTRAGVPIELTRTEFALLEALLRHPRKVLSAGQLYEAVWDYDFGPASNNLAVFVGYLRRKLEARGPRLVHNVRGVGYVLREP